MSEIIDEPKKLSLQEQHPFKLLGIGLFFWLNISSMFFILRTFSKDFLIMNGASYKSTYWTSLILSTGLLVLIVYAIIDKIKTVLFNKGKAPSRLFLTLVGTYITLQFLQFLISFYWFNFMFENFLVDYSNYVEHMRQIAVNVSLHNALSETLVILFAGVVLYNKK